MYNINDTDIFVLKKILGHTSLSATEIYTHIDPKKLKFIMENFGLCSFWQKIIIKPIQE